MNTHLSICSVVERGKGELDVEGYSLSFNLGSFNLGDLHSVDSEQDFHETAKSLRETLGWLGPYALLAETEDSEGRYAREILDVIEFG